MASISSQDHSYRGTPVVFDNSEDFQLGVGTGEVFHAK